MRWMDGIIVPFSLNNAASVFHLVFISLARVVILPTWLLVMRCEHNGDPWGGLRKPVIVFEAAILDLSSQRCCPPPPKWRFVLIQI